MGRLSERCEEFSPDFDVMIGGEDVRFFLFKNSSWFFRLWWAISEIFKSFPMMADLIENVKVGGLKRAARWLFNRLGRENCHWRFGIFSARKFRPVLWITLNHHGNFQYISQRNGFDRKCQTFDILETACQFLLDFDAPIGDEDGRIFPLENSKWCSRSCSIIMGISRIFHKETDLIKKCQSWRLSRLSEQYDEFCSTLTHRLVMKLWDFFHSKTLKDSPSHVEPS